MSALAYTFLWQKLVLARGRDHTQTAATTTSSGSISSDAHPK
jgi:hypothetical protein